MDLRQPTTMTEARALIGVFQYYRDICPRRSHVSDTLKEMSINPKGREILWNDDLEVDFFEIKCMVYVKTLLHNPTCKIPFPVHTDASDKSWVLLSFKMIKLLLYF